MKKKILVAIDGSNYSSNIYYYLENLFTNLHDIEFHLVNIVPCGPMKPGHEWLDELDRLTTLSPVARKKYAASNHHLKNAVDRLIRSGMHPNNITYKLHLAQQAHCDDIIRIARKGLFDAIVIGRRGLGKIEELIMGSTSHCMLDKCREFPVWIIDGRVNSRSFLVPVDGSEYTLKAVDHLAFILNNNPYAEITLFNSKAMLATTQQLDLDECYDHINQQWCEQHRLDPDICFSAPEEILTANGFPRERIHRLTTETGIYPSRQIVRQALMDDFGTIVMGRRPLTAKKPWGSVTAKVLAMAENTAIWIVG